MTSQQVLPIVLIFIDIAAAIVYIPTKDFSHVGYWVSAAAITFFATFKI